MTFDRIATWKKDELPELPDIKTDTDRAMCVINFGDQFHAYLVDDEEHWGLISYIAYLSNYVYKLGRRWDVEGDIEYLDRIGVTFTSTKPLIFDPKTNEACKAPTRTPSQLYEAGRWHEDAAPCFDSDATHIVKVGQTFKAYIVGSCPITGSGDGEKPEAEFLEWLAWSRRIQTGEARADCESDKDYLDRIGTFVRAA